MAGIPTLCAVPEVPAARPISRRGCWAARWPSGWPGWPGSLPAVRPSPRWRVGRLLCGPVALDRRQPSRRPAAGLRADRPPSGVLRSTPGFAGQLDAWLADLAGDLGRAATRLRTYGTWTDGGAHCASWHDAGRAFDLARLRLADGSVVSCRYDLWRDRPAAELEAGLRSYWALAAGLHLHFAYVLTYLYNAQHHNHIHVDNGRSGPALSTFRQRSPAPGPGGAGDLQLPVGRARGDHRPWDGATRDAARRVRPARSGDDLTDGRPGRLPGRLADAVPTSPDPTRVRAPRSRSADTPRSAGRRQTRQSKIGPTVRVRFSS